MRTCTAFVLTAFILTAFIAIILAHLIVFRPHPYVEKSQFLLHNQSRVCDVPPQSPLPPFERRLYRKVTQEERKKGLQYIHHHMPRTGGGTLDNSFRGHVPRAEYWGLYDMTSFPWPKNVEHYRYLAGHFYTPFWDFLEWYGGLTNVYKIVILRDPRDRVISSWAMSFVKMNQGSKDKLRGCLKHGKPLPFCKGGCPRTPVGHGHDLCPTFSNLYVERMASSCRSFFPKNNIYEQPGLFNTTNEFQFEKALETLYTNTDFVWITERYQDSLDLFNYLTGENLSLLYDTHIMKPEWKEPYKTEEFRDLIKEANVWDFKLWEIASAEFDMAYKLAFENDTFSGNTSESSGNASESTRES